MQLDTFVIKNKVGLHARPAALFVQTAAEFEAKVTVRNVTRDTSAVDGKSILSVMTLGVSQGHEIEITTEGADEQAALEALTLLISSDFSETNQADTPS